MRPTRESKMRWHHRQPTYTSSDDHAAELIDNKDVNCWWRRAETLLKDLKDRLDSLRSVLEGNSDVTQSQDRVDRYQGRLPTRLKWTSTGWKRNHRRQDINRQLYFCKYHQSICITLLNYKINSSWPFLFITNCKQ